ncbi:MAG: hypothetical protein HKO53_02975, partial [Gemmatimonadetes bacterium]|nr:hypothetical protein [Gemmatimonadota bacterium]
MARLYKSGVQRGGALAAALVLATAACLAPRTPAPAEEADLVLRSGRVWTGDESGAYAQALAIQGSDIVWVGSDDAAAEWI